MRCLRLNPYSLYPRNPSPVTLTQLVTEPQSDGDEMIVKILQRLPAFVVAIVPPFGRPSDAAVERDDQSCIRLVVVERPVTGGTQHAIAHVDTDIAHHCHIETEPPEVAVLDIDRAIGREQLRNEEQNVRREIRARVVEDSPRRVCRPPGPGSPRR